MFHSTGHGFANRAISVRVGTAHDTYHLHKDVR